MKPITARAYELFHEGAIALADVERHGMHIDEPYLNKVIAKTNRRIDKLTVRLQDDKVWRVWQKLYGTKAKLTSGEQLGQVLFKELGYEGRTTDEDGKPAKAKQRFKVDEEALAEVDLPFVRRYLKRAKLVKARDTYLLGIQDEMVNGQLHAFFNLHTVKTFRSSSDSPNLQNQPVRNEMMAEIVRRCFIPPEGFQFLEIDYSALEVRGIACYSRDPTLIKFLVDDKDPHFEWAANCYKLKPEQITKQTRFYAKNQFVFPEFYGSYYVDCARSLWDVISTFNLETSDGVGLYDHLKQQGIKKLGACDPKLRPQPGTFEKHIQEVEDQFRNKRYKVHTKWREDSWEQYKRKGYIDTLTGFRLGEVYRRNQIINSPIQGSCFHCLLWSLTQLHKWLKKHKFQSRIVCQIHDSMLLVVHTSELQDVLAQAQHISTVAIRDHWKWIIVPMAIEAELAPVGGSWHEKKKIDL